ncbi:uncharacterized protein SCHCODRAFT_02582006 [Schizophyllum commune H4-8]|nr:uncharacterized protein SCHCODRAFT_02582006 [Schizophyllum commune H4-8]KAI5891830.1 hypothetical protein SCHCODRAFT_02582006 [Schizophyllum commune H4-8]
MKKIPPTRLVECLDTVRVFRAVLKSQPNVLAAIRPHYVIPTECDRDVIFPNLRVLELVIQNPRGVTEHNVQNLIIPLLSPELKRIQIKTGKGVLHMHDMYTCIAQRSKGLEELSLSSTSAGLAAAHFLTIHTISLQELHDARDVVALGSISGLKNLIITKQTISPLRRVTATNEMTKDAFSDLVNLEITANDINALTGLFMTLPFMTPSTCSLLILRSDKDWAKIFELLEKRIAPTELNKLELWFRSETLRSPNDHDKWRDSGLTADHLRRLSPYRNLRQFHFSASNIDRFQINAGDEDIKFLAMTCPRLVDLILEGSPAQTKSSITLMALEYIRKSGSCQIAPKNNNKMVIDANKHDKRAKSTFASFDSITTVPDSNRAILR